MMGLFNNSPKPKGRGILGSIGKAVGEYQRHEINGVKYEIEKHRKEKANLKEYRKFMNDFYANRLNKLKSKQK